MERKHNAHFNLLWQEASLLTRECITTVKDKQSENSDNLHTNKDRNNANVIVVSSS